MAVASETEPFKTAPQASPQGARRANVDTREGFLIALATYFFWGFLPFYMKAVAHIPAAEVVAHRIVWSVPIAGAIILLSGNMTEIRRALSSPRTVALAALTASIITINWGIYVWSIAAGRALESALGYYINPLFSIFLAAMLLGERLTRLQIAAVVLAGLAVAFLTWEAGSLPWVSVCLTFSWGFYALFKKTLAVGASEGFFLEVLLLSIPAAGYIVWLEVTGRGHFLTTGAYDTTMLLLAGVITAVPLIMYAHGAKLLRLSTIGIMQYIAPTMIFVIAVFVFGEPFGYARMVAFALIWSALALYSFSLFQNRRR
jgi:chloramphenicol-sensitive protein RarD